jgi:hypothetical protein
MRSVKEYLEKAAEFEAMAAVAENETLMARYADIAACYRLLARDRQRLVETGVISTQT